MGQLAFPFAALAAENGFAHLAGTDPASLSLFPNLQQRGRANTDLNFLIETDQKGDI